MSKKLDTQFKMHAAAAAVASCLSLSPVMAEAAGLGKITVLSGLGQPLRAEVEISATRDELAGMTARLAPQDVFRQAGIDFGSNLLDLRFSLDKRANGKSVVKVSSSKPINEPFLDFLVELNWPSGRLVREYTFLLDPPEVAAKGVAVSSVEAKPVAIAAGRSEGGEAPQASARVVAKEPAAKAEPKAKPKASEAGPAPAPSPEKSEGGATRQVKSGDTLRKIAGETQYEGVSLEQMLVGLHRANADAFIGGNMNRLKAGAILNLPEKEAVAAIPQAEAKKVYLSQTSDWNNYRQKLASAVAQGPAKDDGASQSAGGKIAAKVEEKAAPAEASKDQVKVSKTEAAAKGAAAGKGRSVTEEDVIAKDKALKEANDRLAMLEKNVAELQKLVEMKNQSLAELQKQTVAGAKKADEAAKAEAAKRAEEAAKAEAARKADEVRKAEEAKKAEELAKLETAKRAEDAKKAEEAAKAEEAKKAEEAAKAEAAKKAEEAKKPEEAAKPAEPPKPAEPAQPPVVKKPVPPPPEPEPEEETNLALPLAGGGIIALLAGYFFYKRRRTPLPSVPTTAAPSPSSLGPNSVFRATGGQSVDTGQTPPQTADFSQTGPGTIDTDEVDPVAEADVYMAYGRDAQAEEILLEAMQKDPQRVAIHAKLLEIYANRKSLKQFETLASELYAQTGGTGNEWEKVAAMGVKLDPGNPLYSSGKAAVGGLADFDADATMVAQPAAADGMRATVTLPGALAQMAGAAAAAGAAAMVVDQSGEATAAPLLPTEPEAEEASGAGDLMSLDFDLGTPATATVVAPSAVPEVAPATEEPEAYTDTVTNAEAGALDFNLEASVPSNVAAPEAVSAPEADMLDFDLGLSSTAEPTPSAAMQGLMVSSAIDEESAQRAMADTFVGVENAVPAENMVDFELETSSRPEDTVVNPNALLQPEENVASVDDEIVDIGEVDADALEFDVKLTDSTILGQPMQVPSFDMGAINLDLGSAHESTVVQPMTPAESEPAPVAAPAPAPAAGGDAHWEEVNTKLDLAKAYEEMGDLEGARELLQEVVKEGPADLVEQAQGILSRIG